MYVGKIVEAGSVETIFNKPEHPYTKALLAAVPEADPKKSPPKLTLTGEVTTPIDPPPGCRLQGRCPMVSEICTQVSPELLERGPGHYVACHNL